MKIALIGYGRMGREIEAIAIDRGHTISAKISRNDPIEKAIGSDVAIEFSTPNGVINNLRGCLTLKLPVVCGTTGWKDDEDEIVSRFEKENGTLLYASNFSLGVNLFFEMNRKLAQIMSDRSYKPEIKETHHIHKLDAPSGTAISLADDLVANNAGINSWEHDPIKTNSSILPIYALRKEEVNGIHTVTYRSDDDCISMTHEAYSRKGFALGAVIAAEWLIGKTGVYGMRDILNLKNK